MSLRNGTDWALGLIRTLPRVSIFNLRALPVENNKHRKRGRGQHFGRRHGGPSKGARQRQTFPKLGYEGTRLPSYMKIPVEGYYTNHHIKRQYPPISLLQLQLLIDTKRIDPSKPIDLSAISNTKIFTFNPQEKHFGFNLTDEGMDLFTAKVNIEVQWTTEAVIAAVEKCGGTITTAYYDIESLHAARDPISFFKLGKPIPKRMIPPEDAVEYYTSAKFRGYLADPDEIARERLVLAQKYGYTLPDLSKDPIKDMLLLRKDPKQIFYGLEPGWVISLRDKCILKPKNEKLLQYYRD